MACFVLFIFRGLFGVVEVLSRAGITVEGEGMKKFLIVAYVLFVLGAWIVLGITLILRRSDSEAGLGTMTGVTVLVTMGFWLYVFMSFWGIVPFEFFVSQLASAASTAVSLIFACWLLSVALKPVGPTEIAGGRLLLRLGAVGTLLVVVSLAVVWEQAVGGRSFGDAIIFMFAVLGFLGLVGAGLGYLGQTLASKRQFGLVAAVLVWLQLLFFVLVFIWARSTELIWIEGLLTLAAQVAGGISFIVARKLAAPKLAVAAGVILLASAVISLVLLAFLGRSGFDLPWTVRNILVAVTQAGMMAAFTLATVHHLMSGSTRREGLEGS
jgi:hypothetical protein